MLLKYVLFATSVFLLVVNKVPPTSSTTRSGFGRDVAGVTTSAAGEGAGRLRDMALSGAVFVHGGGGDGRARRQRGFAQHRESGVVAPRVSSRLDGKREFDVASSALHLRRRGPRRRTVVLLAASPIP